VFSVNIPLHQLRIRGDRVVRDVGGHEEEEGKEGEFMDQKAVALS
jgi:hypothetical protein